MADLSNTRSPERTRGSAGRRQAASLLETALEAGKLPPQAPELEQAVLGALMLERNAVNEAIEIMNTSSDALTSEGRSCGRMTRRNRVQGPAPRSAAASVKLWGIFSSAE